MTPKLRDAMSQYLRAWDRLWLAGIRLSHCYPQDVGPGGGDECRAEVTEAEALLRPAETACQAAILVYARPIVAEECARIVEGQIKDYTGGVGSLCDATAAIREYGKGKP